MKSKIELVEVEATKKYLCIENTMNRVEMQKFISDVTHRLNQLNTYGEIFWMVECLEGNSWLSFEIKYDEDDIRAKRILSFIWDGLPPHTEEDAVYVLSYDESLEERLTEREKELQEYVFECLDQVIGFSENH